MTRRLFILMSLLLTALSAVAFTIRVNNATANTIIVTPVSEPEPEPPAPGQTDVFGANGGVFDSSGGVF